MVLGLTCLWGKQRMLSSKRLQILSPILRTGVGCILYGRFIWRPLVAVLNLGAVSGPRYDCERYGILEAFGSLRQCDLIVVHGTVTRKMAPRLRWIYDQMPEPKWVIAMGACSITGGVYFDSYNVLPGVDQVVPVDVYVPGCPPRPEMLIDAFLLLQDKIRQQNIR